MAAAELARSDAAAEQKAGRAREQELAAKVAAMEAALWVRPPPPAPPGPPFGTPVRHLLRVLRACGPAPSIPPPFLAATVPAPLSLGLPSLLAAALLCIGPRVIGLLRRNGCGKPDWTGRRRVAGLPAGCRPCRRRGRQPNTCSSGRPLHADARCRRCGYTAGSHTAGGPHAHARLRAGHRAAGKVSQPPGRRCEGGEGPASRLESAGYVRRQKRRCGPGGLLSCGCIAPCTERARRVLGCLSLRLQGLSATQHPCLRPVAWTLLVVSAPLSNPRLTRARP